MSSGVLWMWSLAVTLVLVATGSLRNSVHSAEAGIDNLEEVYAWVYMDYAWPSEGSRQEAIDKEDYIPKNNVLVGVKVWQDRLYVSVPRWQPGVPSTLNWVPYDRTSEGPPLSTPLNPFPSWEMQEIGNCTAIQYVQSMEIDPLGRMWVLDTGRRNIFTGTPDNQCPPKLLLLDLNQDGRLLHTFVFPDEVASHNHSLLDDLVIDVSGGGNGSDWYAYITDPEKAPDFGGGIVVYHLGSDRAWRINDNASMTTEGGAAIETVVGGKKAKLAVNVDGIALASLSEGADKLYYSPLGSFNLYSLPTSLLRDPLADPSVVRNAVVHEGRKTSQVGGMAVDSTGALYLSLLGQDGFSRWSREARITHGDPSEADVLAVDHVLLQWVDGFGYDDIDKYLFLVTNRMQNLQEYNFNEVNFRLLRYKIHARSYMYQN